MKCMSCKHFRECLNEAVTLGQLFDPEYDGEHGCSDNMFEPISNADRIRAMSDEELSEFINAMMVCDCCTYDGICSEYNNIPKCRKGVLEWLQKPVDRSADDGK